MKNPPNKSLLSRLTGRSADNAKPASDTPEQHPDHPTESDSPIASSGVSANASGEPSGNPPVASSGDADERLDVLLNQLNVLASSSDTSKASGKSPTQKQAPRKPPQPSISASASAYDELDDTNVFLPVEPETLEEAHLREADLEELILKSLFSRTGLTGREIAEQIRLPFVLINDFLRDLKNSQLVAHRKSAAMNDFEYDLTDFGRERARRYSQRCTYFGASPVSLTDYIASVEAQSLTSQHPTSRDLHVAFEGLLLSPHMMDRLGPALNSGRGLFLYGAPGNGKTSIAERATRAFGNTVWIPRSIGVGGEIIRLFDPITHVESPLPESSGLLDHRKVDKRWVRIERPTVVAGGELTMSSLELTTNETTGICEAPLQLKSNCGTLLIDDFGRQRMSVDDLLNRWIVPLEKRYDFLNLPNGKKIEVPFDQLIIFSTNLEPRDLVDEAFLRRIPYKIEAIDPTEQEFRGLFDMMAPPMGFTVDKPSIDYLIETHYKKVGRPLRFCQPRDLLLQIRNYCNYHCRPLELTPEYFDLAVENYFAVM